MKVEQIDVYMISRTFLFINSLFIENIGSGKSALLANWTAKRREHRHRDEFLFQHFVGCSTPSLQV
jgi:hypothetical protein